MLLHYYDRATSTVSTFLTEPLGNLILVNAGHNGVYYLDDNGVWLESRDTTTTLFLCYGNMWSYIENTLLLLYLGITNVKKMLWIGGCYRVIIQ